MKNSLIFDLDGTLWEVLDSTLYSANVITKKYGLEELTKDTICGGFGLNREDSAKLYFPNIELEKAKILIDEIGKINIENLKKNRGNIYPNLNSILNSLSDKYDLYIVSNTSKVDYIRAYLNTSGTDKYFKDYIAASGLGLSKADAIKRIISDNGIEKSIYIGDTKKDLEAANENSIPFIQALYGFGENLNTKYSISEFKELPDLLEKIDY